MKSQLGIIDIPVNKAGLVFKKYGKKTKRVVATNGEAGYQAELLGDGRHYNLPKLQYTIKLIDPFIVKDNEIALVYAKDGMEIDGDVELGKGVECNNFEDATAFLNNGGERGNQLKFLKKGKYFLNPLLFKVITKLNASEFGLSPSDLNKIIIEHNEMAVVIAKYGKKIKGDIKIGKAIECNEFRNAQKFIENGGEKGEQISLLEEGEYYINPWLFKIITKKNAKENDIRSTDLNRLIVEHNEIALVSAKYGKKIMGNISLGKVVNCNNFQDGQAFMENGGEKGNQLQVLTEGEYFINPLLFKVISKNNATDNGFLPKDLNKYFIPRDMVGIVSVLVGQENHYNEISKIEKQLHESYQKPQSFFEQGGYMGIQEEVLSSGTFAINPWFAEVKQVPITEVPTGTVGVVVSHTGSLAPENTLVGEGHRGIWSKPLREGKHPLNTDTKTIKLIPTNEISLEWKAKDGKKENRYDIDLEPLELKTKDGYSILLEVSQTIQIRVEDAPKLILKVANTENRTDSKDKEEGKYPSIRNLISKKIKAMVQSHFTTVGHTYNALYIKENKGQLQDEALDEIREELNKYGVNGIALAITIKQFPKEIEDKLKQIAEEEQKRKVMEAEIKSQSIYQDKIKGEEGFKDEKLKAELNRGIIDATGKANISKVRTLVDIDIDNLQHSAKVTREEKEAYTDIKIEDAEEKFKIEQDERKTIGDAKNKKTIFVNDMEIEYTKEEAKRIYLEEKAIGDAKINKIGTTSEVEVEALKHSSRIGRDKNEALSEIEIKTAQEKFESSSDENKAIRDANIKKIGALTDVEIYEAKELVKVKISETYAQIEVIKKKGFIDAYGQDNYVKIKQVENFAKIKFPEYSRMDMTGLLFDNFYNTKTNTVEDSKDEDMMEKLLKVFQVQSLMGLSQGTVSRNTNIKQINEKENK